MSTIKTKSKPKTNRLTLPWYLVLPIYLILSGGILVFTTALQKGSVLHTLQNYLAQPLLLALNLLPILAVLGLLYAIFGNIFYADKMGIDDDLHFEPMAQIVQHFRSRLMPVNR